MFIPSLGKPSLFIILYSLFILCTLGFLFPFWAKGVTVPISIKLKFNFNKPGNAFPFLSNPAANPRGFDSLYPKRLTSNNLSFLICFFGKGLKFRRFITNIWEISGGNNLMI